MPYRVPPSLLAQPGRSQNWAMDTRRQAFDLLGREQSLRLNRADRERQNRLGVIDAWTRGRLRKQAQKEAEEAQGGFFGSGGGTAVGSLAGLGIGALVPGASIATAALGGTIGGAAGGVADVAMAPGTRGAAAGAQQAANLPSSLMAYDQYSRQGELQGARQGLIEAQTGYYERGNPRITEEQMAAAIGAVFGPGAYEKFGGPFKPSGGPVTESMGQNLPTNPTYTAPYPFTLQPRRGGMN